MDNSRALAATVVGAVLGGLAGYLFFTEHGRSVRRQIEPDSRFVSFSNFRHILFLAL